MFRFMVRQRFPDGGQFKKAAWFFPSVFPKDAAIKDGTAIPAFVAVKPADLTIETMIWD